MAEIVWGAPLVDFAQFQIHPTSEELGVKDISDGYTLGYNYALWFKKVSDGFEAGVKAAQQEVTGQYQESSDPTPEVVAESNEKLNEIAEQVIKDQLGATTVEPWTKTPAPATKPKKAWDIDV